MTIDPAAGDRSVVSRAKGWYVADRFSGLVLCGPYKWAETAGAVREEMEQRKIYSKMNLWICRQNVADEFDAEYERKNKVSQ